MKEKIINWIRNNLPQIAIICGICFISIGAFLHSPTAGFITTGCLIIVFAIASLVTDF